MTVEGGEGERQLGNGGGDPVEIWATGEEVVRGRIGGSVGLSCR